MPATWVEFMGIGEKPEPATIVVDAGNDDYRIALDLDAHTRGVRLQHCGGTQIHASGPVESVETRQNRTSNPQKSRVRNGNGTDMEAFMSTETG